MGKLRASVLAQLLWPCSDGHEALGWRLAGALAAADAGLASRSAGLGQNQPQPALNGHPNRLYRRRSYDNHLCLGT